MATPIKTPRDLQFAGFYYEDLLAAFARWKREFLPDHTETDAFDLVNGMGRVFAMFVHTLQCMVDDAAAETFPSTALSRASFVQALKLVGRHLKRETSASVDVLATLTKLLAATETLVTTLSRFSTMPTSGQDRAVEFEYLGGDFSARPTDFASATDASDRGIVLAYEIAGGTFTVGVGSIFWTNSDPGDATYFGHPDLMFTRLDITLTLVIMGLANNARWEVYDDLYAFAPDTVADLGGGVLRHYLTGFYGASDVTDTELTARVTYLPTGAYEDVVVEFSGGNHYIDGTSLGQMSPSENANLYKIQPSWVPPENLSDGTNGTKASGTVTWDIPQSAERRWAKTTVNGIEAYWMRVRAIGTVLTGSTLDAVSAPIRKWHWLLEACQQGRTVVEDLGLTTTDDFQSFVLGSRDLVEGSAESAGSVQVGTDTDWTVVRSLYGYDPDDKVAQLVEDPDGTFRYVFGDGTTGKVPPAGQRVIATYRRGALDDGNVGAGTVVVASKPLSFAADLTNPRAATGWQRREGATEASLEALRLTTPGYVRARNGAVTAEGTGALLIAEFLTSDGRNPIVRAEGYEDPSDPQSARIYCVGSGGSHLSADDLAEAATWLNGVAAGWQQYDRRLVINQQVTMLNYVRRIVDITVTVYVLEGFQGGVKAAVEVRLADQIRALGRRWLVTDTDQATGGYIYRIGGKFSKVIPLAAVKDAAGEGFIDQTLTMDDPSPPGGGGPLVDVAVIDLAEGELPVLGTVAVTVVAQATE